jgi:hypothetical protein
MRSIFNGEGYYLNDDRASGGKRVEGAVLGCGHHNGSMAKEDWQRNGGMCFVCGKPICAPCMERTRTFGCEVFEKKLDSALSDLHRREQNAKILGV